MSDNSYVPGCVVGAFEAMKTRFECVLPLDGEHSESSLRGAIDLVREEVEACEARLSAFAPGSIVSRVNKEAHAHPVRVDPDTLDLLTLSANVSKSSGGAFDVSVGPLLHAWGLRGKAAESIATAQREAQSAYIGMQYVSLDTYNRTVRYLHPGMQIDLGAVAKGHSLDLAAAVLRDYGVSSALLHAGTSSIVAMDAPKGLPGWRVQIAGSSETVTLNNCALGVSGQHGRSVTIDNVMLGHIIDPRTRMPVIGSRIAAAVSPTAAFADAWSTALLVAPQELQTDQLLGVYVESEQGVVRSGVIGHS